MGQVIILPETTKYPISLIGERAGCCWGADISDDNKNYKRGISCINSQHGRVLEYINVELILKGYSARVIREWYTHIGGSPTRLQESTRYVNCTDFEYITPPSVNKDKYCKVLFTNEMRRISETIKKLEEAGIPREDSAMLLPLGMGTTIVDKRNARNLIDMSHQRLCSRAYWEYRILMRDICKELSKISDEWAYLVDNYFVPKCDMLGYCPEAKSCGKTEKRGVG